MQLVTPFTQLLACLYLLIRALVFDHCFELANGSDTVPWLCSKLILFYSWYPKTTRGTLARILAWDLFFSILLHPLGFHSLCQLIDHCHLAIPFLVYQLFPHFAPPGLCYIRLYCPLTYVKAICSTLNPKNRQLPAPDQTRFGFTVTASSPRQLHITYGGYDTLTNCAQFVRIGTFISLRELRSFFPNIMESTKQHRTTPTSPHNNLDQLSVTMDFRSLIQLLFALDTSKATYWYISPTSVNVHFKEIHILLTLIESQIKTSSSTYKKINKFLDYQGINKNRSALTLLEELKIPEALPIESSLPVFVSEVFGLPSLKYRSFNEASFENPTTNTCPNCSLTFPSPLSADLHYLDCHQTD